MKICIVRHGSAEQGADEDSQRNLTTKGLAQVQGAGRWLMEQLKHGDLASNTLILSSPYLRAQQTAEAIAEATALSLNILPDLVPHGKIERIGEQLMSQTQDLILVSHLPLVGRLAAKLVDGQMYDQPWSPAECWLLEGDIAASGCMSVTSVWYPALEQG